MPADGQGIVAYMFELTEPRQIRARLETESDETFGFVSPRQQADLGAAGPSTFSLALRKRLTLEEQLGTQRLDLEPGTYNIWIMIPDAEEPRYRLTLEAADLGKPALVFSRLESLDNSAPQALPLPPKTPDDPQLTGVSHEIVTDATLEVEANVVGMGGLLPVVVLQGADGTVAATDYATRTLATAFATLPAGKSTCWVANPEPGQAAKGHYLVTVTTREVRSVEKPVLKPDFELRNLLANALNRLPEAGP